MNPLDKIKEGVLNLDWSLVCEGYAAITGKLLIKPVEPHEKNTFILEMPFNDLISRAIACKILDTNFEKIKCAGGSQVLDMHVCCMVVDKPDTKDSVAEICDISQPTNNDDAEQPTDDDDENVEFDAITKPGEKVGLFGNPTVLITEKPTAKQIEINKRRAAARREPRVSRPPPKTYEVKCTDCEKTFDSHMRAGDFGQKCSKCLRSTKRER